MKLRIKGNSLRLRLTRPEVAQVEKEGLLESQTDFGTQTFRVALAGRDEVCGLSASFQQNTILVAASKAALSSWAESDDVGLYGEQATSTGEALTIAVEKDFRCLDRSRAEEDDADA